ncbi:MAG: hypothetical protein K0S00_4063 [Xanthobacteraceae bacterium]|jgi:lambda family phage tail tape measure protein|nr:hypothetical protein [Xanthobacteraceae bacterium]
MAERNVNVRLQVIDGGKVKAELASVGEVGAVALDRLQQRSQQAAAAVNQLRTHEVTNLTAQLTDLGVQVLSGQSFGMAMIQQGPQIAAVLGERGVKASLLGVGAALASLVTPTTAVLAGIVALGYGASFVFDAMSDDTEDASKALERHQDILRLVAERYGDVEKAAKKAVTEQQRQVDLALAEANARSQSNQYSQAAGAFADTLSPSLIRGIGQVYGGNVGNSYFAAPIEAFLKSVRDGVPDIEAFRAEVARMMNEADDPAIKDLGADLLDGSSAASKFAQGMSDASLAVRTIGSDIQFSAEQLKTFKKTLEDWAKAEEIIANIERSASTVGDDRQRAIDAVLGRLPDNATSDQRDRAAAAAATEYDRLQAQRAQEKAAREAASEAQRDENRLVSEAKRIYESTRTASEAYADTLAKLQEHLEAGRIDQETYNRAVAAAAEVMEEANRQALESATDAASGYQRFVEDYLKSAQDMASATEDLMVDAFGAAEDAFVDFVMTGKAEFSDLVNTIIADLARLAFRQAASGLLSSGGDILGNLVTGLVGSIAGGLASPGAGGVESYFVPGYANNNSYGGPRAYGGAVKQGFDYWVGENGPEKFTAPRDGYIVPNSAVQGQAPRVQVIVNTLPGQTADVVQRQRPDGVTEIEATVRRIASDEISSQLSEGGDAATVLERRYGLRRGDLG